METFSVYQQVFDKQTKFFQTKTTYSYSFRIQMLKQLKNMIVMYQKEISKAVFLDLGKSEMETYMCEIGLVLQSIKYAQKHLKGWMKTKKVKTSFVNYPSKSYVVKDPRGVTLIISPWNYPVLLALDPLIGAIVGGNTCILKLSEISQYTSSLLVQLLNQTFPSHYIKAYHGEVEETTNLLNLPFDFIFFTGSERVGKIVMEKASKHLTPVCLELGGKSPCLVTKDADIYLAAKRIAFGKILNAGQTCVAPDFIYIDETIKDSFIKELENELNQMLGNHPLDNQDYPKIIHPKHHERLTNYLKQETIIYGGKFNFEKIEPTLLYPVQWDSPIMQEEIFGPIFPILTYSSLEEAIKQLEKMPHPLALYVFGKDKDTLSSLMTTLRFGGGCMNDTVMHLVSDSLPFGGVGPSGMGSYHGKYTFDTFTRSKGILRKSTKLDIKLRYHPYTNQKQKIVQKILK